MSTTQPPWLRATATTSSTQIGSLTDAGAATDPRPLTAVQRDVVLPEPGSQTDSDVARGGTELDYSMARDGSLEPGGARESRLRTVSDAVARDFELSMVLLSYIKKHGPVSAGELVEQGDPEQVFRAIFDFYDADVLRRTQDAVELTPMGTRILARFLAD